MTRYLTILLVLWFFFIAPSNIHPQDSSLRVVTTTTIIADIARNVGADLVEVVSLVPPDSDIHAFQATPAELVSISEADLVLANGAGLEEFLDQLLANIDDISLVVVSEGIEPRAFGAADEHHDDDEDDDDDDDDEDSLIISQANAECALDENHDDDEDEDDDDEEHGHTEDACDPHFWTDPQNVIIWTNNIARAFAEADPDNADIYMDNAAAYIEQLEALDAEIRATLAAIPEERRVLVTNHDFMGYFAAAYNFEIVGTVIPSLSTLAEPNPRELASLIALIEEEGVPAIFAEISASDQLARTVAEETGINVVTDLYSEALSAADGPAATYIDYMRFNAQTIVEALSE